MRLRLRAAGFLALAFVAITCTESTTGPRSASTGSGVPGRVALAPQFTPAAARAYQVLSASGTAITDVHIHLTAADGSTRDTVIAFPAGKDTLQIEISVPASQNDQPFTALLELRASDGTVLFSGTQVVLARAANLPPLAPPVVTITYSGPGKRTRTVALAPPDTTVVGSPTLAYSATAIDSSNAAVQNLLVQWASSDSTVAVLTQTGKASASVRATGKRGVAILSASTPTGIVGSSKLTVVPPATHLVLISGGSQTGVAGSVLPQPVVIEVQAADNLPVPGTSITFSAVSAGGIVGQATAVADNLGRASTTVTLGKTGGAYQYAASAVALPPLSIAETATPAPPIALTLVSGDGQTDSTGRTLALPLVVKATDTFGGAVAGAIVTWTRTSGSGALGAVTTTSAPDGTTSTTYTLGGVVGTDSVTATLAGVSGAAGTVTFTLHTVNRGAATITVVSGAGQSGAPGSVLPNPLIVLLSDGNGNPIPNQLVTFAASANGATFLPASVATGANGRASSVVTLGVTAGTVTITIAAGALTAATSASIVASTPASITKIAGDQQTATVATAVSVAPSVVLKDAGRNPVSNVQVTWAVSGGGGSATGLSSTTNAQGIATVGSWTLGNASGQNALTATAAGSLSAVFTATGVAGTGSALAFLTPPSATAANAIALGQQPIVQLKDVLGNPVNTAGVVVGATVTNGTGTLAGSTATTNASGVATFSGLTLTGLVGSFTLSFTAPGYSALASGPIVLSAGTALNLNGQAGANQTATVFTAVPIPPAVIVTDMSGNPVAGTVVTFNAVTAGSQIANASTTGTTLTVTTNALGIAALASWTLGTVAQQYALTATAAGLLGSPYTITANGVAGNGTLLALATAPSPTASSGVALAVQPVVQLKDAQGNNVTTASVVITATVASGTGTLTNATATTIAGGIATFSGLAISGTAGSFTLSFTSPGYTPVTSGAIVLGAGAASTMALNGGNNQSTTAATAVPIAPSVKVSDASGNGVAGTVVTFTTTAGAQVANGSTSGTTVTVTTNASGIAALASWTLGPVAQSYTMTASAGGVSGSPVTFSGTAIAGAASKFAVTGLPATLTVGAPGPTVTVQLVDALNNPVAQAGVQITGTITSQPGNVSASGTAPTNASGAVVLPFSPFTGPVGTGVITFAAAGVTTFASPTIQIVAGAATKLVFTTQPGATAQSGSPLNPQPVVQIADVGGNPVSQAGVTVTVTAINAGSTVAGTTTAVTNASGSAAFTNLIDIGVPGGHGLSFDAPGLSSATVLITLSVGQPTTLTILAGNNQSATVNTPTTIAPSVHVTDASNAPVPGVVVTFAIVTSGAQVSNGSTTGTSVTVLTNASGNAVLTQWVLGPTAQFYTMTASAAGLPVATFSASGVAGAGAQLGFGPPPSSSAQSGVPLSIQPGIQLKDAFGNAVSTAGVLVTATISSGTGTLINATATTVSNGVATFSGLTISGTAGNFVLAFNAPGYSTLSSGPIAVNSGTAYTIALNAGNNQTATVGTNVGIVPSVKVTDVLGNPVAGVTVTFTALSGNGAQVSNGSTSGSQVTVVTNSSGIAPLASWTLGTVAALQVLQVTASVPNGSPVLITATALAGTAQSITIAGGNLQSATVGSAVPVPPSVLIRDAFGNPVSGYVVQFTAVTAGSTVSNGSTTSSGVTVPTNASGIAQLNAWTLGIAAGPYTMNASGAGLVGSPLTFSATANAGAGSQLVFSVAPSASAASGVALGAQPVIQLKDALGNNVTTVGVQITASIASGSGSLTNATATTVSGGTATFSGLTITGPAGSVTLAFNAPTYPTLTSGSIALGAGVPTVIALNAGNNQSATVGTAVGLGPSVIVKDAVGNPVTSVSVTFVVASGGGSATGTTVLTNGSGIATVGSWTLGTSVGTNTLTATSGSLTGNPVTFTATGVAGAASTIAVNAGNNQSATVGQSVAIPPAVLVKDANGNPVSGVVVTFAAITAGGQVSNTLTSGSSVTVTTNSTGVAALVAFNLGFVAQTYTLNATAAGLIGSPLTFTELATAGPATKLAFQILPSSTASSGVPLSPQPVVQIQDANGNPVLASGVPVTATITSGSGSLASATATTSSSGQAVFTNLTINGFAGSFTLSFAAPGLAPVAANVALSVGPAKVLIITTVGSTTATDGVPFTTAPAVELKDSGGNFVLTSGVTITAAVASGSGTITSGGTAVTNTSGIATFNGLTITGTIGSYTIKYTSSGLTSVTSAGFITLNVGAAANIVASAGANQSATTSDRVPVAPAVLVTDVGGNPVSGTTVTFAAVTPNSQIQDSNTCCNNLVETTSSSGIASLIAWVLSPSAGTNLVTATASGLSGSPVSITATGVTNTSGGAVVVNTQPSSTNTSGAVFTTQPAVGMYVPSGSNANIPVTVFINYQIGGSSGTLSGTTTVTTNASGFATFSGLKITGAGSYTLRFSSPGYSSINSTNITIQ